MACLILLSAVRRTFSDLCASEVVGLSPIRYRVVRATGETKADKTAVTAAAKRLQGLAVNGSATAASHGMLSVRPPTSLPFTSQATAFMRLKVLGLQGS